MNNSTGVKHLSIVRDKNAAGHVLMKYAVHSNFFTQYFGVNKSQRSAFKEVIDFMWNAGLLSDTKKQALASYDKYDHEQIVVDKLCGVTPDRSAIKREQMIKDGMIFLKGVWIKDEHKERVLNYIRRLKYMT